MVFHSYFWCLEGDGVEHLTYIFNLVPNGVNE